MFRILLLNRLQSCVHAWDRMREEKPQCIALGQQTERYLEGLHKQNGK